MSFKITIIFIFFTLTINAQNILKRYSYSSVFTDSSKMIQISDSLTFQFTDSLWFFDRNQHKMRIEYHISEPETIDKFISIHPLSASKIRILKNLKKKTQKQRFKNYRWYDLKETTGFIDNDSVFWMHSPRSNQFIYCQVAPLIEIEKKSLFEGSKWETQLIIFKGFPSNEEFVGELKSEYTVTKKTQYNFLGENIECWEIKGIGNHSKLGISSTTFLYNSAFGILQIHYHFFDKTEILLKLQSTSSI
jgi:hypothetical protein